MPRKTAAAKRDTLAQLDPKERARVMHYGDAAPIAGVLSSIRLLELANAAPAKSFWGRQATRTRAFLGDWVAGATPENLELLARAKRRTDWRRQPADYMAHLESWALRVGMEAGKTPRAILEATPTEQLQAILEAKGVRVEGDTLRKALRALYGAEKPAGRPKRKIGK